VLFRSHSSGGEGHSSPGTKAVEVKSIAQRADDRSHVSRMVKIWTVPSWTVASPALSRL
jgi:hypothetical protein